MSYPQKRVSLKINNIDSRVRGNDELFRASLERILNNVIVGNFHTRLAQHNRSGTVFFGR